MHQKEMVLSPEPYRLSSASKNATLAKPRQPENELSQTFTKRAGALAWPSRLASATKNAILAKHRQPEIEFPQTEMVFSLGPLA